MVDALSTLNRLAFPVSPGWSRIGKVGLRTASMFHGVAAPSRLVTRLLLHRGREDYGPGHTDCSEPHVADSGQSHTLQDRRLTSRSRDTKSQMVSSSNAQSSVQLSSHPCVRHWKQ